MFSGLFKRPPKKIGPPFFPFLAVFGPVELRFAQEIDGELLEYGVKFAQKMAPNGLRENRKLQINMPVQKLGKLVYIYVSLFFIDFSTIISLTVSQY